MSDVLERTPPPADHRIHYGAGELQFGDLRMPAKGAAKLAPVIVFIHGGWWKAAYSLEYAGHLCNALKAAGVATWSLEYRRVGNEGGGFPGTFQDVAAGFDYLGTLAKSYALDLERIVVAGHSAGGHLAFWLAGRQHIPAESPLHHPQPALPIRAVVGLAGALDLRMTIDLAGGLGFAHIRDEVTNFMGGTPDRVPERYAAGNPGELLPLNVPQILIQGTEDDQIPQQLPAKWVERAHRRGERASVEILPGADHLDIVDPQSKVWARVQASLLKALG